MGARIAAGPQAFHADSPTTAIHDRVAPQDGDIIVRKTRVGAFSTTDLEQQLRDRGIDTLILAGISTSGVVLSTVRDASDRDYRLFVLSDATADRDPAVHAFLIEQVFPRQADVITLAELEGAAGGGLSPTTLMVNVLPDEIGPQSRSVPARTAATVAAASVAPQATARAARMPAPTISCPHTAAPSASPAP